MEILGKSKRAKLKVDPNVITEAVAKHIETSNFPKKTEVKRIRATNAYYQEKVKQHNKVIETGQNQIEEVGSKLDQVRTKCFNLLARLRADIGG